MKLSTARASVFALLLALLLPAFAFASTPTPVPSATPAVLPTPAAVLIDSTTMLSNAWVTVIVITGVLATFVAVVIGWKLGFRVLRSGISMFRR